MSVILMRCFVAMKPVDEETPLRDIDVCSCLNSRPPSQPVIQYPAHLGRLLDDAEVDVKQTHNSAAIAVDEDISGDTKRNGCSRKAFDSTSAHFPFDARTSFKNTRAALIMSSLASSSVLLVISRTKGERT